MPEAVTLAATLYTARSPEGLPPGTPFVPAEQGVDVEALKAALPPEAPAEPEPVEEAPVEPETAPAEQASPEPTPAPEDATTSE